MVAIVLSGLTTGPVLGQEGQGNSVEALVKAANVKAEARYKKAARLWNEKLTTVGTKARFRRMAKDIIAFEEKIAQGVELFEGKSTLLDRMRFSFRKRILDERKLIQQIKHGFASYQQELIEESIELYVKAGLDRRVAASVFQPLTLQTKQWDSAFDPVLVKAKVLAEQDWVRAGGVQVGSYFGGEGLADAARQSGLWAPKKDSFWDLATQLVADIVVEEALEEITDPSEDFAAKLRTKYVVAQKELLESKSGLLPALRKLTSIHQHTRSRHLVGPTKGGR